MSETHAPHALVRGIAVTPYLDIGQRSVAQTSTADLLRQLVSKSAELAKKELELARTELKANVDQEVKAVRTLVIAAAGAITVVNLALVAGVFALSAVIPGWLAALSIAGAALLLVVCFALVGRKNLVQAPLERTRKSLEESVQWAKERLA
ncbi:MAG: phage holin family protein [Deltaproteobacteria bacterium]|nr:phage holin family protein [Deltaproteobacteria bacterium]